jgi:hypothetical protein
MCPLAFRFWKQSVGTIENRTGFHRGDGSYVVAAAPPRNTGRKPTDNQKAYRTRFSAAIAHAKVAKNDPTVIEAAKQHGMTAFNWAVSEFLETHKDESRIDTSSPVEHK